MERFLELDINTTVYVDINQIVKDVIDGSNIDEAIEDNIAEMDDCEYYLIGSEEREKIKEEVNKRLDKMKPKRYNVYRKKKRR